MNKFIALMRRYCNDYTNCQDFSICDEIMVPDYTLHMGSYDLSGRDEHYKPAAEKQFEQFPGLCLTVNELVTNGERLIMRFSEHGASLRHDGAKAAWSGIGLYRWDGERLTENYVEQDYYSRRRQLASGQALALESAAIAPWDTQPGAVNEAAEALVGELLEEGAINSLPALMFDDAWAGSPVQQILAPGRAEIRDLFSAGEQVAFNYLQHGRLLDDFEPGNTHIGEEVFMHMAGLLTVRDGRVVQGRVIRDRLGLYRRISE